MQQPRSNRNLEDLSSDELRILERSVRQNHLNNPANELDEAVVVEFLLAIKAILDQRAQQET
jgi:hypothetical protein